MRQFSNPTASESLTDDGSQPPPYSASIIGGENGCFIRRYLQGESRTKQPDILFGRTGQELPCLRLCPLQNLVVAAHTGPDNGLMSVNQGAQNAHVTSQDLDVSYIDSDDESNVPPVAPTVSVGSDTPLSVTIPQEESTPTEAVAETAAGATAEETREIAGVVNWNRPCGLAFGTATSLYERHPVDGEVAGNPVADAFAVVARTNNAVLALADGVNWGERAALAARSAIHGCVDYLNRALFTPTNPGHRPTTNDVFLSLLRSFHAAHSLILQEGGLLTTLTAAVVAELDPVSITGQQPPLYMGTSDSPQSGKFAVCVCNVGDSLAYVYSPRYGVREITQGSHDIHSMRDMRDALGALGPVDGQNPELNNLTCSLTVIDQGDIVFLTSDGVSDNFDPVVGKFVVARKGNAKPPAPSSVAGAAAPPSVKQLLTKDSTRILPTVEAFQRHELTLLRMEDILRNGMLPSSNANNNLKARQLCEDMVDFATRLTSAKRHLLEDVELYVDNEGRPLDKEEQKVRRRRICERLALIPGKLDHATVVAYEAGVNPLTEPVI